MDGQLLLRNAIMRNHADGAAEKRAYTRALNKFDHVPDDHNYAADFKMLCREIIAKLDSGQESATDALVSLNSAPVLRRLPTEVRNRLDELEEQQRKASWLRPANWPRLFAKLAMGKLGAVLGTTLLMKPLCSAACAPEMADSWDAVPGLAPVWERLCG